MALSFFKKVIDKITGKKVSAVKEKKEFSDVSKKEDVKKATETDSEVKEIKQTFEEKTDEELINEINNVAPGIFAQAKTPEMKRTIIRIYREMLKDNVDIRNEKEVEKWMKKHPELIQGGSERKIETYRREQPKIGRNDPCPCGSGKKYKKCCGKNA